MEHTAFGLATSMLKGRDRAFITVKQTNFLRNVCRADANAIDNGKPTYTFTIFEDIGNRNYDSALAFQCLPNGAGAIGAHSGYREV